MKYRAKGRDIHGHKKGVLFTWTVAAQVSGTPVCLTWRDRKISNQNMYQFRLSHNSVLTTRVRRAILAKEQNTKQAERKTKRLHPCLRRAVPGRIIWQSLFPSLGTFCIYVQYLRYLSLVLVLRRNLKGFCFKLSFERIE